MQHNYSTSASKGFRLPKYLSATQAERVLHTAASLPLNPRYPGAFGARFAAFATLYYTGIRRAELIGLDCTDVDFEAETIRVIGKGDKERLLPLHPDLAIILQNYIEDRLAPKAGDPLFVSYQRRRLSYETVHKWLKAIGREAGVPWLHPHVLRHTVATRVIRVTRNPFVLQALLGHANINTTMIYVHTEVSDIAEALRAAM